MAADTQPAPKRLGPLGLCAIAAGFLIFGVATLVLRNQPADRTSLETDRAQERAARLAKLRESDTRALSEFNWVDRGAGVVGLPLERAIELTLPVLKSKPVRQGPLIPPPAATNAPPAGATNAPPASAPPAPAPPTSASPAPAPSASLYPGPSDPSASGAAPRPSAIYNRQCQS